ncbi:MAG: FAD/NAD(P)-binding protein [Nanoarchaeota archaeon]|nr:FAD/NAD(P)-binding protein [Nanoarchaeota archaeon]
MKIKVDIGPYKPEPKKIISYKREAPDSFTIRLDWQIEHGPGQFVFCSAPGIGESAISICSDSRNYVDLNIREVGNVTNELGKLQVGDELLVRGPYGTQYPMQDLKGNDFLIIGGGCGVAPLRGVIKYIDGHREDFNDISLFLGFRSPEDALFKDEHEDWDKRHKLFMKFDKMEHENSTACYTGSQGFVTDLVKQEVHDNTNKIAIVCGPPIMIDKTVEILREKGFHDDQIFLSAERLMYCGMARCGRCMIRGKYTCVDGSVFRLDHFEDE